MDDIIVNANPLEKRPCDKTLYEELCLFLIFSTPVVAGGNCNPVNLVQVS